MLAAMELPMKIAIVAFVLATFLFMVYWAWQVVMDFRTWLWRMSFGQRKVVLPQQPDPYAEAAEADREVHHYNALPMASGREDGSLSHSQYQGRGNERLRARSVGGGRRVRQRPPVPPQYSGRKRW